MRMTAGVDPAPVEPLRFASRARWRSWLKANHGRSTGIWLVVAKKHAEGLHYEDAVEEALCFGWIDSTVRRMDADYYRQWYSPRKTGSNWSRLNKERVENLIREGRMEQAGKAAIDAAKKDGSWNALDTVEKLELPHDLGKALDRNAKARAAYDRLPPSHKKQYLYWVNSAARDETRERRIAEVVARLAKGIKPGE